MGEQRYMAYGADRGRDSSAPKVPVDILVVDDNPSKRVALQSALAPLCETIVCAGSGQEALRHLLTKDFATIILDVNMPELDGFETARMIRSRVRSSSTPIIFVSAVSMDEADAFHGYSLGAVDYICAPIVPEVLCAKVGVFVELHRKSEEARLHAERLQQRTLELEQSQRELRLSERMASIGTLCAGLGHDMGNLLLPVGVWIDTVRAGDLPDEVKEGVESLRLCVQYLRKLAGGLRLVSLDPAQDIGERRVVLKTWIDEVAPILRNALPRGVALEVDIAEGLPPVSIAAHRLAQAAFNLVQNAGEALRGRDDGLVRLWASADGEGAGVRVGVTDNGPGMSPHVVAHCLDPFFTTKTRGISTGLGLSLVHGIVQSAGARLEVRSMAGTGTTFSFVLAAARDTLPVSASAVLTIDDARLRALAAALVRAAGCVVVPEIGLGSVGAAIWVTDREEGLDEGARRFKAGKNDREVFLVKEDGEPGAGDGHVVVHLTGARGLVPQLRRFLSKLPVGIACAEGACAEAHHNGVA